MLLRTGALFFNVVLCFVVVRDAIGSKTTKNTIDRNVNSTKKVTTRMDHVLHKKIPKNMTYSDTPDNSMHVPFQNNNVDIKYKRKIAKKSPKRTIQKIIKKGRMKKKFYVNQMSTTTVASLKPQDSEEQYKPNEENPTTVQVRRRKPKKFNSKLARNPMPFHTLQSRKDAQRRTKRKMEKDNAYIIQDLDEIEFLSKENGSDVANVHVKRYW